MTPVKKTVKKDDVKVVEEVKEEVKAAPAEEKKTEEKAAPKKAAPKKAAAKKAAKTIEKAVEAVKEDAKKAVKKTAAKKAAAPETNVYIEFNGYQFAAKTVLDKAMKAYAESGKGGAVKTFEIYVKPQENVAYYVVNGEGSDDYKVEL